MLQTTSTTTGTNMIARARVYLSEPTAIKWSEAQLLQILNDVAIDICMRTKCLQTSESVTLVANTVEYTPTATYIDAVAAILNPATGAKTALIKGNISSIGRIADITKPAYFYEFAGKVGFYPAYTAVTTQTVTLYMATRPAIIAAGGTVPTPALFDQALVFGITANALMLDGRIPEANNYFNLYFAELDRFRQDFVGADNETEEPIR